jgi:hypothetical protein
MAPITVTTSPALEAVASPELAPPAHGWIARHWVPNRKARRHARSFERSRKGVAALKRWDRHGYEAWGLEAIPEACL